MSASDPFRTPDLLGSGPSENVELRASWKNRRDTRAERISLHAGSRRDRNNHPDADELFLVTVLAEMVLASAMGLGRRAQQHRRNLTRQSHV